MDVCQTVPIWRMHCHATLTNSDGAIICVYILQFWCHYMLCSFCVVPPMQTHHVFVVWYAPPPLSCPTPCPSGGLGDCHLVNTNIFVTAHCVVVWVIVL